MTKTATKQRTPEETAKKNETSLLLYCESRAVDQRGILDVNRMNDDDRAILDRWKASGFVESGRVAFDDIPNRGWTTWVRLSDAAWILAHSERRARAEREQYKRQD